MVELTDKPIDVDGAWRRVGSKEAGAVVVFVGTTREMTAGRRTVYLTYEAYPAMAVAELSKLELAARQQWSLVETLIVHRLGRVDLAEASIVVAVSSAHRRDAFAAATWLMDRIKEVVPIWKQEHWADGTEEWIHPIEAADNRSLGDA